MHHVKPVHSSVEKAIVMKDNIKKLCDFFFFPQQEFCFTAFWFDETTVLSTLIVMPVQLKRHNYLIYLTAPLASNSFHAD